jgi:PAS domain S-box-containing protein
MDQRFYKPAVPVRDKHPMVDDPQRLRAVVESGLLDTAADPLFDELCLLAAETAATPIALVTILDDRRQFFKARVGLEVGETPVEWSFCQHALAQPDQVLTVSDALLDERFRLSPLVTGEPFIRAYLGAPLVDQQGAVFGTLCVIDREPRDFSAELAQRLSRMAKLVSALIDTQANTQQALKAVKQEAEREIEKLIVMLTHSIDVQAYADTNGVYRYVNQAFARAFGRPAEQTVGRHISEITGPAVFEKWIRQPFETAARGEASRYRRLATFLDQGERWIDVDLFPVRDGDESIKGVVIRARDVHDIVVAQTTIEQRLISQAQFINALAHDVREPLRTINGFVSLVLEEGQQSLPEEMGMFLRQAQRGVKRLSVLVDDLLAFLKADGKTIRLEPVDLRGLFNAVIDDLSALVKEHRATVTQEGLQQTISGAPVWLRLLLQNLIVNGIKYARAGVDPEVRVAAKRTGDVVTLSVSDNGTGIDKDDLGKLFLPFSRLVSTRAVPGSGLGLALCQKVAELHGSTVQVASRPAAGSVFTVVLQAA